MNATWYYDYFSPTKIFPPKLKPQVGWIHDLFLPPALFYSLYIQLVDDIKIKKDLNFENISIQFWARQIYLITYLLISYENK